MNSSKQTLVTAFALFSLFFGAGNLILPPFLGYNAGDSWLLVSFGFALSAVVIPILAIYGHAKLQGSILDFAKKVSPWFAFIYAVIVYLIAITLPAPRTASVTYEMAFQPYFDIPSWWVSTVYFGLVLIFVLNRTKILSLIGKFLTPLIFLLLLAIVVIGLFSDVQPMKSSTFENALSAGILEGYQTFDALGGVVVGAVIVISFALQGKYDYQQTRKMIGRAGLLAGIGLFLIYTALIALGAFHSDTLSPENRTDLLNMLSRNALGNIGNSFLAVLVALACFTTAVGIITGTADFIKGISHQSQKAYVITAVIGCLLGLLIGQFDVPFIIDVAVPALMFIYPITIVLILLNVSPERFATKSVFRGVVLATFVFSIPDFLGFIISEENLIPIKEWIPLASYHLGWILPAAFTFVLLNLFKNHSLKARNSEN